MRKALGESQRRKSLSFLLGKKKVARVVPGKGPFIKKGSVVSGERPYLRKKCP